MAGVDVPDGMALACRHCGWRPAVDLMMGVAKAHFETEHDTDDIHFDLIVVCPRCDKAMEFFASWKNEDHFQCVPCRRGRKILRTE
jgi:DNA-directed RNA polymerase subunit RPC12/RpoP